MRKVKKTFWEFIVPYPSFKFRFIFVLSIGAIIFLAVTKYALLLPEIIDDVENKIAMLNLIIQAATLLLGILAAYYALRQLVETRFTALDESAMHELRRKKYSRAFDKWREAFHIKPEVNVFTNLVESLLLVGDYDTFDEYIRIPNSPTFLQKSLLEDDTDKILVLYLKSVRHLLVKNQGEAEKHIANLVSLFKSANEPKIDWDYVDLLSSSSYQDLSGECKTILDNLMGYMQRNLSESIKVEFEGGNYASKLSPTTLAVPV